MTRLAHGSRCPARSAGAGTVSSNKATGFGSRPTGAPWSRCSRDRCVSGGGAAEVGGPADRSPSRGWPVDEAARTVLVGATFSASGERAAVMVGRGISPADLEPVGVVVDLQRARLIGPASPQGGGSGLSHMAISPDGTRLLVGDAEGLVRVDVWLTTRCCTPSPGSRLPPSWPGRQTAGAVGLGHDGTSEVYSLDPLRRLMNSSGSDRVSALAFVGEWPRD